MIKAAMVHPGPFTSGNKTRNTVTSTITTGTTHHTCKSRKTNTHPTYINSLNYIALVMQNTTVTYLELSLVFVGESHDENSAEGKAVIDPLCSTEPLN